MNATRSKAHYTDKEFIRKLARNYPRMSREDFAHLWRPDLQNLARRVWAEESSFRAQVRQRQSDAMTATAQ